MAAKKKASKRAKSAALPKGYKSISGFGNSWPGSNPKVGATLTGTILRFKSVKQTDQKTGEKRTVKLATIATAGGEMDVWESAGLKPLFALKPKAEVFLRFEGMGVAKKGQNAPRLYSIGTK